MQFLSLLNTYLLYITVSILPFIWWPWAAVSIEVPRVYWFIVITWLLCILSLGQLKTFLPTLLKKSTLFKITGAFLLSATVSTILSDNPLKGLIGNYYRADGLITLISLLGFSVLISCYKRQISQYTLATSWFVSSVLIGLWSCIDRLYILPELRTFGFWPEPSSISFGNVNFLAGYLVISLPFGWYLWQNTKKALYRALIGLGMTIIILAILASQSIGAIACLLLASVLLFLSRYPLKISVGVLAVGIVAFCFIFYVKEVRTPTFVAEGRPRIFSKLLLSMVHKPLFGWGVAQVDTAFDTVIYPYYMKRDIYLDKAHSTLLETLVTTGIVGLTLYLFIWGVLFKKVHSAIVKSKSHQDTLWHKTMLLTLIIFLFHSQTNIISINEELIFWFILGWYL